MPWSTQHLRLEGHCGNVGGCGDENVQGMIVIVVVHVMVVIEMPMVMRLVMIVVTGIVMGIVMIMLMLVLAAFEMLSNQMRIVIWLS